MAEVMSDGQILKSLVLSKAARGKYISVHRTIRDLKNCDDYMDEAEGKDTDMDLIKSYILGQANGATRAKPNSNLSNLTDTISKLNDRLDKAGL